MSSTNHPKASLKALQDAVYARGQQKSEGRVCNKVGEIQGRFSLPEGGKVTEELSHTGGASGMCGGMGAHTGL